MSNLDGGYHALSEFTHLFGLDPMERYPQRKKVFLIASMVGNIGTLAIFKYLGFAFTSVNAAFQFLGVPAHLPVYDLILPVGIRFYTFESLSYTIDVYKGHIKPTHNIFRFVTTQPSNSSAITPIPAFPSDQSAAVLCRAFMICSKHARANDNPGARNKHCRDRTGS